MFSSFSPLVCLEISFSIYVGAYPSILQLDTANFFNLVLSLNPNIIELNPSFYILLSDIINSVQAGLLLKIVAN